MSSVPISNFDEFKMSSVPISNFPISNFKSVTQCGMVTTKSPRKVMRAAHELGQQLFLEHAHKFSRKDYTLAQLFACLALRDG
jgi:hypothetical protein